MSLVGGMFFWSEWPFVDIFVAWCVALVPRTRPALSPPPTHTCMHDQAILTDHVVVRGKYSNVEITLLGRNDAAGSSGSTHVAAPPGKAAAGAGMLFIGCRDVLF